MSRQLKFGLEIEVATTRITRRAAVNALRARGINAETANYSSGVTENVWKLKTDGSLSSGWEVVSPPLTDTKELEIVLEVLRKELKVRCTNKCGLHIHHDVNDLNLQQLKNIYKLFEKYEMNAVKSIMSPNRDYNSYCRHITDSTKNLYESTDLEEWQDSMYSRYFTLNNKCYVKYGTVEFRGAQGTIELDRILAWIDLTSKIVEIAAETKEIKPLISTTRDGQLEEMFNELKMTEESRKHYRKVQKYFNKVRKLA